MFWKKKTSDLEIIEYSSNSRRESYRIDPEEDTPIFACFGKHRVRVTDISAGGVSFECDQCSKGDRETIRIELSGPLAGTLQAQAEIIRISDHIICHSKFVDIDEDTVETLHRFVLHHQVKRLRETRKKPHRNACDHDTDT